MGKKSEHVPSGKENGKLVFGLILGLIGCVICWGDHVHYSGFLGLKSTRSDGTPEFLSVLFAVVFVLVLYAKKIIEIKSRALKIAYLLDIVIFASMFELFFGEFSGYIVVVMVACFGFMLFGSKGLAKLFSMIGLVLYAVPTLEYVSKTLGINALVPVLLFVASLFLQENFSLKDFAKKEKAIDDVVRDGDKIAPDEDADL